MLFFGEGFLAFFVDFVPILNHPPTQMWMNPNYFIFSNPSLMWILSLHIADFLGENIASFFLNQCPKFWLFEKSLDKISPNKPWHVCCHKCHYHVTCHVEEDIVTHWKLIRLCRDVTSVTLRLMNALQWQIPCHYDKTIAYLH